MQLATRPLPAAPLYSTSARKTILIIEDDTLFLPVLREMLRRHGHKVFTATDVAQAEETWACARHGIDAVICDEILGYDRGSELLRRFQVHNPVVKLVLCSGCVGPIEIPGVLFLPKPFDSATLLETLE